MVSKQASIDNKRLSSISRTDTVEGIAAYWEEHSLAEHWHETREVTFVVRAQPRSKRDKKVGEELS